MTMVNFSCRFCQERYVGCHSTCEKYKQERAELDRQLKDKYVKEELFRHNKSQTCRRAVDKAKKQKKQAGYSNLSGRR